MTAEAEDEKGVGVSAVARADSLCEHQLAQAAP